MQRGRVSQRTLRSQELLRLGPRRSTPRSRAAAARCQQQHDQQQPVRRLVMMRHAVSQSAGPTRDHDRPILPEGAKAAADVARQLKERGWVPDVVICSNALRTRQTLDVMRRELPELDERDSHFLGSLYTVAALDGQTRAHLQDIIVAEAAASQHCVLLLGHDRGWSEAASSFTGRPVGLGNSHAALLEGRGESWAAALDAEGAPWELVGVLVPQGETPRMAPSEDVS